MHAPSSCIIVLMIGMMCLAETFSSGSFDIDVYGHNLVDTDYLNNVVAEPTTAKISSIIFLNEKRLNPGFMKVQRPIRIS